MEGRKGLEGEGRGRLGLEGGREKGSATLVFTSLCVCIRTGEEAINKRLHDCILLLSPRCIVLMDIQHAHADLVWSFFLSPPKMVDKHNKHLHCG